MNSRESSVEVRRFSVLLRSMGNVLRRLDWTSRLVVGASALAVLLTVSSWYSRRATLGSEPVGGMLSALNGSFSGLRSIHGIATLLLSSLLVVLVLRPSLAERLGRRLPPSVGKRLSLGVAAASCVLGPLLFWIRNPGTEYDVHGLHVAASGTMWLVATLLATAVPIAVLGLRERRSQRVEMAERQGVAT